MNFLKVAGIYFILLGVIATPFTYHLLGTMPYWAYWCVSSAPIGSIGFGINLLLES